MGEDVHRGPSGLTPDCTPKLLDTNHERRTVHGLEFGHRIQQPPEMLPEETPGGSQHGGSFFPMSQAELG